MMGASMLDCVERACQRATARENIRLQRGRMILGSIATAAPLIGVIGCCVRILASFHGFSGDRDTILFHLIADLSQTLEPFAISLAIATIAWVTREYIRSQTATLEAEMKIAASELRSRLAQLP